MCRQPAPAGRIPSPTSRPSGSSAHSAVSPVQDVTNALLMAALDTCQRFQLSYWDAAIIEASRAMGCAEVLSEDLGDGQDYAGIRVINPFR